MNREIIGKVLAIVATLFLLALPIGVLQTLIGIFGLFQQIAIAGTGDPRIMADGISAALVSTLVGLISCFPGLLLLIVSISVFKYRPIWVYILCVLTSILLLFLFPVGTLLGMVGLITLMLTRKKYGSREYVT